MAYRTTKEAKQYFRARAIDVKKLDGEHACIILRDNYGNSKGVVRKSGNHTSWKSGTLFEMLLHKAFSGSRGTKDQRMNLVIALRVMRKHERELPDGDVPALFAAERALVASMFGRAA